MATHPFQCNTCHFYKSVDSDCGECRLNPPTQKINDKNTIWEIIVANNSWCGKYQSRDE